MSIGSIGTVSNHANKESMKILAMWNDSFSAIELGQEGSVSSIFSEEYSHYIVVHDPLDIRFPEKHEDWNKRFSNNIGASVVEFLRSEGNTVYVKGLIAENGSAVYGIMPYTAFDQKDAHFPGLGMQDIRKAVLAVVLPQISGRKILDIGCGTGSITVDMAHMNPDSMVYGVEIVDGLVQQCRMNAELLGVRNTEFKTGDIYDLPFEDSSVDTATCFFMLHHLGDIPRALLETRRVLKAKGKLITVDPIGHFHGPDLDESGWQRFFEGAGYSVETLNIGGAVVSHATPSLEKQGKLD
ncbi:MAG: methyltransferase domain-containing protein [Methanosarcinaceae archaeon]|nr:methyltransferase domain-containing protein [Methanosarcinaceae archaeon]